MLYSNDFFYILVEGEPESPEVAPSKIRSLKNPPPSGQAFFAIFFKSISCPARDGIGTREATDFMVLF
jgi:hypothetical protein